MPLDWEIKKLADSQIPTGMNSLKILSAAGPFPSWQCFHRSGFWALEPSNPSEKFLHIELEFKQATQCYVMHIHNKGLVAYTLIFVVTVSSSLHSYIAVLSLSKKDHKVLILFN